MIKYVILDILPIKMHFVSPAYSLIMDKWWKDWSVEEYIKLKVNCGLVKAKHKVKGGYGIVTKIDLKNKLWGVVWKEKANSHRYPSHYFWNEDETIEIIND